jgi:hypothetical protein
MRGSFAPLEDDGEGQATAGTSPVEVRGERDGGKRTNRNGNGKGKSVSVQLRAMSCTSYEERQKRIPGGNDSKKSKSVR